MNFGERIRRLRREKKLDERALGGALGVSFTYISKIENEKLDFGDFPSEDLILRLLRLCKPAPTNFSCWPARFRRASANVFCSGRMNSADWPNSMTPPWTL
jgi:transcriptional regulator with XRE-family HTH domain